MRAFVYARQSEDRTGEEWGVERQLGEAAEFVRARGWDQAGTFIDNDVSAYKRKPRPQFEQMMSRVEAGEADVIVAKHLDRLLRRLIELEHTLVRCEPTGTFIVTTADGVDTSTEAGRLVARILASVAQGEVERKGARQKSAAKQAARQGRWTGGRRPFGYREGAMVPDPVEAMLVRKAYAQVLTGESLYSIAKEWNSAGVKTTVGNGWTGASVSQMLLKPRYAGLRTYHGVVEGAGLWEPIVDEGTWKSAVAVLSSPGRQLAKTARKHLLSGILLCGKCRKPVGAGFNLHPIYKCKHCGGVSKRIEPIDRLVTKLILGFFATDEARGMLVDRSQVGVDELIAEEKRIIEDMQRLAVDHVKGLLNAVQVRAATDYLDAELREVQGRMRKSSRAKAVEELICDNPGPVWDGWSLNRRRNAIIETVELVLFPGVGREPFKPEHLGYRWLTDDD